MLRCSLALTCLITYGPPPEDPVRLPAWRLDGVLAKLITQLPDHMRMQRPPATGEGRRPAQPTEEVAAEKERRAKHEARWAEILDLPQLFIAV